MLAITCDKCRRRFTPTVEEMQGYLASQQGKKHTLVTCPHCGKGNKVGVQRLQQALKFSPPIPAEAAPVVAAPVENVAAEAAPAEAADDQPPGTGAA
ncbi:MAG: hypothetical protein AUK03_01945 [Anaerolineae bacterium CG2_30_64_16]|nr:MAG: hypothetical protein AUK03_01945 [Anaerolineae bacterium CG2_30_64_16]